MKSFTVTIPRSLSRALLRSLRPQNDIRYARAFHCLRRRNACIDVPHQIRSWMVDCHTLHQLSQQPSSSDLGTSPLQIRAYSKSSIPRKGSNESDQARWKRWKEHWWQQLQTVPNCITLTRIACTPILVYWIVNDQPIHAVAGCIAAGVSDFLDGWIAKNYNQGTVLGTYIDPLADKILINSLSVAVWCSGVLPTPIMGIWMTKDLVLMVATYRYVVAETEISSGNDNDANTTPESKRIAFLEKLDPLTIPLKVEPTQTSKANTALQFVVLGMSIVHPLYGLDPYLSWMSWTSAGMTILSLMSYMGYKGFAKSGNLRKEWESGNITRIVKESVQEKNPQKIASLLSKEKEEILKLPRSPIVLKKNERKK